MLNQKKNNPIIKRHVFKDDNFSSFDEGVDDLGISQYQQSYNDDFEEDVKFGDSLDDYNTDVDSSAEKSRLLIETDSYINRIQLTLENKYIEKRKTIKNGVEQIRNELRQIPDTKPLANNFGISQIMGHIKSKISHVTVLGNLKEETYKRFLGRFIKDFGRQLIGHRKEWGVEETNIRDIRRIVVDGIELFLTRPLGDKERGYNWNPSSINDKKEDKTNFMNTMFSKFKNRGSY